MAPKVSGTVQVESAGRIVTTKLDNDRIFEEFGASPDDYVLVVALSSISLSLDLVSKVEGSFPNIEVVRLDTTGDALLQDAKTRTVTYEGSIAAVPTTNLFDTLSGEISGTGKVPSHGPINKVTLEVNGHTVESAVLRFKISASGAFTQEQM